MFKNNEKVMIGDVKTEEYYVIQDTETDQYYSGDDEWDGFLDYDGDYSDDIDHIIKDAFKFKTLEEAKLMKNKIVEEMAIADNLSLENLDREVLIKKVYDNFTVSVERQQNTSVCW